MTQVDLSWRRPFTKIWNKFSVGYSAFNRLALVFIRQTCSTIFNLTPPFITLILSSVELYFSSACYYSGFLYEILPNLVTTYEGIKIEYIHAVY